jgi:hypothetical protein
MFMISRMIDQRPIVLYLRMKWMTLDPIHDDLVHTLGNDAVAYSMVTKYARNTQFSGRREATHPEAPDVEDSPVDEAILTALAEFPLPFLFPFSPVRELSRRICLPRSTGTSTGTSRNHFASQFNLFDGYPTFDGGTEADSGPDGNRTIAGPLGARHAPVERHCHLGRVVDSFVE